MRRVLGHRRAATVDSLHTMPEALRRPVSWQHPARLVAVGMLTLILVGAGALMTPAATAGSGTAPLRTALFTATSASCVTGLAVVDTGTYWSGFGQVVILLLMQIGGLGVMTSASLLAVVAAGRMGLRSRLVAEYETRSVGLGTVRRVVIGTTVVAGTVEFVVFLILAGRLWLGQDYPLGRALWYGMFHAVSAFTNASFALWPDSLMWAADDPWIVLPITVALVIGGLGFLVLFELTRIRPARAWSMHTKITLAVTGALLVLGPALILLAEWNNPATLGQGDIGARLLSGGFAGVAPRTAGFNTFDYGQAHPVTLLLTDVLMFIGGGSGSTAGGVKVTTIAILTLSVVAEVRGSRDVDAFGRRLSASTIRQAISVVTLALVVVVLGSMVLLAVSAFPLDQVAFEVISALGTVGLSTGITAKLPASGQYLLIGLMYLGRIGSITVVTAMAMRTNHREFRYPEGRPIVG